MTSIAIFEAVNTISLPFHGQKIITAMVAGVAYVAMKPIVENIGLDWKSQYAKLVSQREKFGCGDITIPTKRWCSADALHPFEETEWMALQH